MEAVTRRFWRSLEPTQRSHSIAICVSNPDCSPIRTDGSNYPHSDLWKNIYEYSAGCSGENGGGRVYLIGSKKESAGANSALSVLRCSFRITTSRAEVSQVPVRSHPARAGAPYFPPCLSAKQQAVNSMPLIQTAFDECQSLEPSVMPNSAVFVIMFSVQRRRDDPVWKNVFN